MNDRLRQAIIDGNAGFVAAVREHDAGIVGMSALLTTTLPHKAETIAAPKAEDIGADGYGANAGMAVERAKELVR